VAAGLGTAAQARKSVEGGGRAHAGNLLIRPPVAKRFLHVESVAGSRAHEQRAPPLRAPPPRLARHLDAVSDGGGCGGWEGRRREMLLEEEEESPTVGRFDFAGQGHSAPVGVPTDGSSAIPHQLLADLRRGKEEGTGGTRDDGAGREGLVPRVASSSIVKRGLSFLGTSIPSSLSALSGRPVAEAAGAASESAGAARRRACSSPVHSFHPPPSPRVKMSACAAYIHTHTASYVCARWLGHASMKWPCMRGSSVFSEVVWCVFV
jgi:hypothetical protein